MFGEATADVCALRCFAGRAPVYSWPGLAEQLGAEKYDRARDFRRTVARYLDTVRHFWPACPASLGRARPVLAVKPERVFLTGL